MVARAGGDRDMLVKGNTLTVMRSVSSGNLMYIMATRVNNISLKLAKRVDLKCPYHKK